MATAKSAKRKNQPPGLRHPPDLRLSLAPTAAGTARQYRRSKIISLKIRLLAGAKLLPAYQLLPAPPPPDEPPLLLELLLLDEDDDE